MGMFGGSPLGTTVEIAEIETLADGVIVIGDGNGAPTTLAAFTASNGVLKMANGGTGANLVDPDADRILFWDDSAAQMTFLTVGTGLSITGTTISATASGGFTWSAVSGTSQSASVANGYIANNASLVTVTLPSTAAVGDVVRVAGYGAGGWKVAQNASGIIHFGSLDSTTGTGGSVASTNRYDAVELVCTVANNEWVVTSSSGVLTVT